jgi:Tol biopolymer transport system component
VSRGRIAYVGADKQVHVVGPHGGTHRQVTYGHGPGAISAWGVPQIRDHSSWPCWSPDGEWLACFQNPSLVDGDGPAWLTVLEVDGVEERRLTQLPDGLPLYIQWNAQGGRVAALTQVEDLLELAVCEISEIGAHKLVEQGVPLFFSWFPDGRSLLVHTGEREGAKRLVQRAAAGDGCDAVFADPPGSFCTPLVVGEQVIYVSPRGAVADLCTADLGGERSRVLAELEGLVAVVPSPDQGVLAFSCAARGSEAMYDGVWSIRMDGRDEQRRVYEGPAKAFFWSPDGSQMLIAALALRQPGMRWRLVDLDTGRVRELGSFWPSQDQLFYLHFFEQFSQSHPLISPDGTQMVFAGHPNPDSATDDVRSRIFVVDITEDEPAPAEIALGDFAVFSHR